MSGRTSARLIAGLLRVAPAVALLAVPAATLAKEGLTQDEALAIAFPEGTSVERKGHFLTTAQLDEAKERAEAAVETEVWTQYVGTRKDGTVAGYAYFDTHLVRTLPETLLVVVSPDGTVARIEVVVFREPPEYLPKPAWYRQFAGRPLDDELRTKRAIRAVTGATLSARAATEAVRRVLAVHAVLARAAEHAGGDGRAQSGPRSPASAAAASSEPAGAPR